MSFVLDSSVALTWCFEDERTAGTEALLKRVVESGAVVPVLWPLEVLNPLAMAERRRRVDRDTRHRLGALLRDLPIRVDLDSVAVAWTDTASLAERYQHIDRRADQLGFRAWNPMCRKHTFGRRFDNRGVGAFEVEMVDSQRGQSSQKNCPRIHAARWRPGNSSVCSSMDTRLLAGMAVLVRLCRIIRVDYHISMEERSEAP